MAPSFGPGQPTGTGATCRLSIEERYGTKEAFLQKVEQAAQPLVRDRVLLERDVHGVTARAAAQWDSLMNAK